MAQDQEHPPHHPSFWDFIPGFVPNRPGNGVDHHTPPPQFSGAFPWGSGGGWHRGPPHPPHPPHGPHDHHHGPPHPPGPPGAGRGPWDADVDWNEWFGHDGERKSRRHGCSRRCRDHHQRDPGSDDQGKDTEKEGETSKEKEGFPETVDADMPDPEEVTPDEGEYPPLPYGAGRRGGRFHGGRGWRRGRGHHGLARHGSRASPFDFPSMMRGFVNHPFFQNRPQAEPFRHSGGTNESDFVPPIDIFNTENSFVVHVALPGAKKEDVGVNWNPDTNTLHIAGVVHRPGDEEFIQSLVSGERRVGVFERNISLPPAGVAEKEDVDGQGITARMEGGVLVVVVPKVEREWTEIKKVDIL